MLLTTPSAPVSLERTMLDAHAATLSAWLGLEADVPAHAIPRPLQQELARAALADEQPALALELAAPHVGAERARWAAYVLVRALLALGRPEEALAEAERHLAPGTSIEADRLLAEAL